MNKIRSKKGDIFLLVDCKGNFTEITHNAFCSICRLPTVRCESMAIRQHEPLLVENEKTGEHIILPRLNMNTRKTIARKIDEHYEDVFNISALCELQQKIASVESIEFIIL